MTNDSAVQFEGSSRIHMALPVHDLERSIAFYSTLFGQAPSKTRPGYAKFEVAEPRVNLSLNQVGGNTAPVHTMSHFGVQLKSMDSVRKVSERLTTAGIQTRVEESVTCCYAVQNKIWANDPDGNPWEVYVLLHDDALLHTSGHGTCCPKPAAAADLVSIDSLRPLGQLEKKSET
jgi:extradiol dioxygenase family protein